MEAMNYNWETTHETASRTMTHTFSDRVKVVYDFGFGIMTVARDGDPIDKFECSEMSISEYETFLLGIAKSAEILEQTSHE
jgi:inorganic pyrophosphatase